MRSLVIGAMPDSTLAIALYAAALVLGAFCLILFVLALKRTLARQEEVVATMLDRYDYRLAEFAQTLSDALNQTLPARITAAISGTTPVDSAALENPDHSSVVRVLELAREQTAADAAVAIVGTREDPILATVGLSQAEVSQVGGLGVPDYRGARAIQVSFVERRRIRRRRRSAAASPCRSWTRRPIRACSPC